MSKEFFTTEDYDKGLVITLVREANIKLASLDENSSEYQYMYWRYKECIDVMRAIENTDPQNDEDINFILNTINTIWSKGILSPLTLKDDEFDKPNKEGICYNIRCSSIRKYKDRIYNSNAFKCTIRAEYNHDDKIQVPVTEKEYTLNPTIFLSKGGVITGEHISICFIRPSIVESHSYTNQSVVNIPASVIKTEGNFIIAVDHREPKLKALMSFYDCPITVNEEIKSLKLNIRTYKKLKV